MEMFNFFSDFIDMFLMFVDKVFILFFEYYFKIISLNVGKWIKINKVNLIELSKNFIFIK